MPKRYNQPCPVAKSLEVIGDRWTLLVVRDLTAQKRAETVRRDFIANVSDLTPAEKQDLLKRIASRLEQHQKELATIIRIPQVTGLHPNPSQPVRASTARASTSARWPSISSATRISTASMLSIESPVPNSAVSGSISSAKRPLSIAARARW